jgi:hypothetical protein
VLLPSLKLLILSTHTVLQFKWAMAGRSISKLESARADLVRINNDEAALPIDLLEVDVTDEASLARLAASTAVLINAVGPYTKYGLPVVKVRVSPAHSGQTDTSPWQGLTTRSPAPFPAVPEQTPLQSMLCTTSFKFCPEL